MSLWWMNFISDTEEVQGVVIVNAPSELLAIITADHLGLSMDYRTEMYGPFLYESVTPAYIERLLTPEEAQTIDLFNALTDQAAFDFYRDVPREPQAETDPHGSPTPGVQAATEDAR